MIESLKQQINDDVLKKNQNINNELQMKLNELTDNTNQIKEIKKDVKKQVVKKR